MRGGGLMTTWSCGLGLRVSGFRTLGLHCNSLDNVGLALPGSCGLGLKVLALRTLGLQCNGVSVQG